MEYNVGDNETIDTNSSLEDYADYYTAEEFKPYEEAAATISLLLFTIIVCLNGFVIFILVFRKQKKSRLFYFVLHLAIADFLVGFCSVLGDGIQSAMHNEWYGGDIFCRLFRFISPMALIASNNLLIGMSVDRFLAIKYPLNVVRIGAYRYLDKGMVFGAWLLSLLGSSFFIPYTRGINANPDSADMYEQKGSCNIVMPESWWKPYSLIVAVIIYVLPTIGITGCYVGICIVVWMKWRSRLKLSEIDTSESSDRLHGNRSLSEGLLPRAKIKSIKMTLVVCLAFFICWTPYFVVMLMNTYHQGTIGFKAHLIFGCLYPLNSACNPLIFMLFNRKLFICGQKDQQAGQSYEGMSTQVTST
ncbi:cardioacceleratory peptide receptor-like isoform X2 [Ruditapes philippinarum]|uniref:cardioacceleratory peptide receptor-like isoform X2 n=1 Tax=Ruditapes philippinarum TaxID=129788 RepID=UPI00295C14C8|nr:cardioacceleratory peptide receptor-like isoform X2 [Ruditapes philippinarum]